MENHKILISRNVIHDESLYHFKGHKVSSPQDTSSISCMPISVPSSVVFPTYHTDPPPHIVSFVSPSRAEFSYSHASKTSTPAVPTLPVLCEAQLETLLPYIPSSSSSEVVLDLDSSSSSTTSTHANDHPMQTRAKSEISKHKDFSDYHCFSSTFLPPSELDEPASYKIAAYSSEWTKAMQEEIAALHM
ncbi:unnamed protein product [Prunus armeniaca]|uniref:Uncharacterized protein n=1 Tax=Prunus armeniaca TaxID=36596 RepID=A0A6J5TGG5_PRUAR|nr:unnamed protein product [Prunus armeniaca]